MPKRVAIIGVDNGETFCDLATPSITSIAANHFGVGYEAARLLADRLAGRGWSSLRKSPAVTVLPLGIVLRRSTDCLAIDDADVVAARIRVSGAPRPRVPAATGHFAGPLPPHRPPLSALPALRRRKG